MEYDHLSFYRHRADFGDQTSSSRSDLDKQAGIVKYLEENQSRVHIITADDIERNVGINLYEEVRLLEMVKKNPHIDVFEERGRLTFQYKGKFTDLTIRNKQELLETINRVKHGVLQCDVKYCYTDAGVEIYCRHSKKLRETTIESDCLDLISSGEVIFLKNKEKKTCVLYPRGDEFVSELSGRVSAIYGRERVRTTMDLQEEIRRGDAIKLGDSWFRVSAAEKKKKAPTYASVMSVSKPKLAKEEPEKEYQEIFSEAEVPLHGAFDGSEVYEGPAYKYGCTNDVRKIWETTLTTFFDEIGAGGGEGHEAEMKLQRKLVELNLSKRPLSIVPRRLPVASGDRKGAKRPRKAREAAPSTQNRHLRDGKLEKLANELLK